MKPVDLRALRALAKTRLDPMTWGYYAGGARDEQTLGENRTAWSEWHIAYRVLAGVGKPDLSTSVLNTGLSTPIIVAPTAFHKLAHPEGEVATARAAANSGSVMCLSSLSTTDMEEVATAAPGRTWFQLYVYRDRGATEALVHRAVAAGCRALVLTVDAPVLGTRYRDVHTGFHLPEGLSVKNLTAHGYGGLPPSMGESGLGAYVRELLDPGLAWDTIDWLKSICPLPLLIKGVVRADDAAHAIEAGADGVVVSNHGGRQLDGSLPTARALPAVAEAVDRRGVVLVDGGIRRGVDVLRALALGADAVLVGRPILWGLAHDGQAGVELALAMLRAELEEAMTLAGTACIAEITRDLVVRA